MNQLADKVSIMPETKTTCNARPGLRLLGMVRLMVTGLLFTLAIPLSYGQNLIPNADFEDYHEGFWTLFGVPDSWGDCQGYLTLFHQDAGDYDSYGVPNNLGGHQSPKSGKAYVGVSIGKEERPQFLCTELGAKLEKGKTYCLTFYISLAEKSAFVMKELQISISGEDHSGSDFSTLPIDEIITVNDSNALRDEKNWRKICVNFQSRGGEKYLAIGSFHKNGSLTSVSSRKTNSSYKESFYYFDKLSLKEITDEAECNCLKVSFGQLNWVYFDSGSATLKGGDMSELMKLVNFLRDHPESQVLLIGHTDNSGLEVKNDVLSLDRAVAVRDFMTGHGIETRQIKVEGKGSDQPLTSNLSPESRAKNRRVEYVLYTE